MNAPNCDKFIERIPAYQEGKLSDTEREEVRLHLECCPACREIAGSLRLLHGAMEMSPLPEKLDASHHEAIVKKYRDVAASERKKAIARIFRLPKFRPVRLPWLVPLARVAIFIILPAVILTGLVQTASMKASRPAALALSDDSRSMEVGHRYAADNFDKVSPEDANGPQSSTPVSDRQTRGKWEFDAKAPAQDGTYESLGRNKANDGRRGERWREARPAGGDDFEQDASAPAKVQTGSWAGSGGGGSGRIAARRSPEISKPAAQPLAETKPAEEISTVTAGDIMQAQSGLSSHYRSTGNSAPQLAMEPVPPPSGPASYTVALPSAKPESGSGLATDLEINGRGNVAARSRKRLDYDYSDNNLFGLTTGQKHESANPTPDAPASPVVLGFESEAGQSAYWFARNAEAPKDGPVIVSGASDRSEAGGKAPLLGDIPVVGALSKSGNGTVSLHGENTYGGGTIVNGGALSFGSAGEKASGDQVFDERLKEIAGAGQPVVIKGVSMGRAAGGAAETREISRWSDGQYIGSISDGKETSLARDSIIGGRLEDRGRGGVADHYIGNQLALEDADGDGTINLGVTAGSSGLGFTGKAQPASGERSLELRRGDQGVVSDGWQQNGPAGQGSILGKKSGGFEVAAKTADKLPPLLDTQAVENQKNRAYKEDATRFLRDISGGEGKESAGTAHGAISKGRISGTELAGLRAQQKQEPAKEKLKTEYPKPVAVGTPVPLKLPNLEKASERGTVATAYANGAYPATLEYNVPKSTMERFSAKDGYAQFGDYLATEGVTIPPNAKASYDAETEKLVITARPDTLESFDKAVTDLGGQLAETPGALDEIRAANKRQIAAETAAREKELARAEEDVRRTWSKTAQSEPVRPAPPRKPAGFNPYIEAKEDAFSTFSIDVDTASYTLTRRALSEGHLPDTEQVRTEEIVNAFDYDYAPPAGRDAFSVDARLAPSPFRSPLELLKIGIKGSLPGRDLKKSAVLTLVIDSSGSMDTADRLGRIRTSLRMLVEKLQPQDSVAIVAFSTEPRLLLDRTPGTNKKAMLAAIDSLVASGSTQLEGGLRLGYEVAARGFVSGAANRVILLSDGVANLGAATAEAILSTVEQYRKQGIYNTVLGFGSGNYDDAMLMELADKGDGMYAFVDSDEEARRLLVDQWEQTMHVIAKDVKIQVEFNPERVARWRQIGYEKRHLKREDFRNDSVDAGEIGAGQSVTALYDVELKEPDGQMLVVDGALRVPQIATVRVRYKDPDTGRVTELEQRITDANRIADFARAPARFRLAACAAEFAELLRVSPYTAGGDFAAVARVIRPVAMELALDQKVQELLRMVQTAGSLAK